MTGVVLLILVAAASGVVLGHLLGEALFSYLHARRCDHALERWREEWDDSKS